MTVVGTVLLAVLGAGAPQAPRLGWDAPPACGSEADLNVRFARFHGGRALVPAEVARVKAQIRPEGPSFRLDLSIEAEPGGEEVSVSLVSPRCETLRDAAALVTSVALGGPLAAGAGDRATNAGGPDPLGAAVSGDDPIDAESIEVRRREPPPNPASGPVGRARPEDDAVVAERSVPMRAPQARAAGTRTARGFVRPGVGASLGMTPRLSGRVDVALGVGGRRFAAELVVAHHLRRTEAVRPEAALRGSYTAGALVGCFAPTGGRWGGRLCTGAEAGAVRTQPSGQLSRSVTNVQLRVAAVASGGLRWAPHPRVWLVAQLEAQVALRRPGIFWTIGSTPEEVFRVARVAGALSVGPMFWFR